ncbi:MAG: lyase family protein, partial [Syntrophomonadaceae bacterium]
ISTDLRLLNSGPLGGLGEITLPSMQIGSTIMPGKVNPVIPEMVTQVAIKVMANDTAITIAAAHGNFELNAFLPLIADCLLESLSMLARAVSIFRTECICKITANREKCLEHLENSLVMVTALTPYIGYDQAAEIVDQCKNDPSRIKEVVLEKGLIDESVLDSLLDYKKAATYNV